MLELIKIRKDINWLIEQIKCLIKQGGIGEGNTTPIALVATEWSANHSVATGDAYPINCLVWSAGIIYKSLINNNIYVPTNATYWQSLGEGSLLLEEQSNWSSTTGRSNIKNKPTKLSDFSNDTNFITEATAFPNTLTPATKTKISYDAKGRVTNGADATTADIPDSNNKRYVTEAQLVTINNQSGINTGDETASTIITKIGNGTVINSQYLPSYVDDILEFQNLASFPTTGETGKIYIAALPSSIQYRWTGSTYIQITNGFIASTDDVTEGSNRLYFTSARVLATILSGLSFVTSGAIVSTDTILQAFGKLQKQITDLPSIFLVKSNNLSDVDNKATARVNLEIDRKTSTGNNNYQITATDKVVVTNELLTGSKIWTLPTEILPAGKEITIIDEFGGIQLGGALTIKAPSAKKLNGVVEGTELIRNKFGSRKAIADGNGNYTIDTTITRIIQSKNISAPTYTLTDEDSYYFLVFTAACDVTVPNNLTALQFQGIQAGTAGSPVRFFAGTGVTLGRGGTDNNQTADQFSVWGIRYLYTVANVTYSLFGRLQQT
jgi:hypothetical protein